MLTRQSDEPVAADITISIVAYGHDMVLLGKTLASVAASAERLPGRGDAVRLVLVDNGPYDADRSLALGGLLGAWGERVTVLSGHGNVGYGRGHNLAIGLSPGRYHLILNPDVELAPEALPNGLAFMESHPDCGILSPAAWADDGLFQYLCKRRPAVADLVLRGLGWRWLQEYFHERLYHYEMRDLINPTDVVWDPPIVSGCFMLCRSQILRTLGGFDPAFFLYFEDFDLCLRAGITTRIAYVPSVKILHHGGGAARKGFGHVRMFATSAVRFFTKYGWRFG